MRANTSKKRKRYNAYRSSSDPVPPKRSRSRHLKALSENIKDDNLDVDRCSSTQTNSQLSGSEALCLSPKTENPDALTLESFQNSSFSCSDSDPSIYTEETTVRREHFNAQTLELDAESIPDTSSMNDSSLTDDELESNDDPYVFPSCPLRLSESVLLIMTLALRHKLAGEALADIIHLIDLHCVPSAQSRPIKTLRELKRYFETAKGAVEKNFYCKFCHSPLPTNDVPSCPICNIDLSPPSTKGYFLVAPIESQLKNIFFT